MTAPFDVAPLFAPGTPAPAAKWNGFPKYNFVGGHNDAVASRPECNSFLSRCSSLGSPFFRPPGPGWPPPL